MSYADGQWPPTRDELDQMFEGMVGLSPVTSSVDYDAVISYLESIGFPDHPPPASRY